MEMAVTESSRPIVQPKWEETSPMKAVSRPIITTEQQKQAQPFQRSTYSGPVVGRWWHFGGYIQEAQAAGTTSEYTAKRKQKHILGQTIRIP